jgi:hypothetical protein
MLSQIIKLGVIFIIFAVIMVVMARDKKVKYGWVILGVLLPVLVYFLCEVVETIVLHYISNGSIMVMAIWDAIEMVVCSLVCLIAGILIFSAVTKSKDDIFSIFKKDYKIWNIVIVVLIVLGAVICIVEGIDYTIHEEEYMEMINDMIFNGGILELAGGEILPGNMKLFANMKRIIGIAIMAGILVPPMIKVRK